MDIKSNKKETTSHIYMVGGKEWIVGERKISKWSGAKCNNDSEKDDLEKDDLEKDDLKIKCK
jgi:hypothetical protein